MTDVGTAATQAVAPSIETGFSSQGAPDRFMRRLLGIQERVQRPSAAAHRAFRTSVMISAIRCIVTYLMIPILIPIASFAGWVAAPVGMVLCVVAAVNGIVSLRRFWGSDHSKRWMYTWFMAVVFLILAVALISDFVRLGVFA